MKRDVYVTDELVMNGATSIPMFVLRLGLDKGQNSSLEFRLLPDSKDVPNKSRTNKLNNFYFVVVVVVKMNRCCDVISCLSTLLHSIDI